MSKIELQQEVTEDRIELYRTYPLYRQAEIYDARTRLIDKSQKRTFVELGLIMVEMEDRKIYSEVMDPEGKPFASLGRWISSAAPVSRSNAYASLNAMRAINEEISIQDLSDMPRANVVTLKGISTDVRTKPEVIAAAKVLSEQDFKRMIDKEHPDQHVGPDAPMRFQPTVEDRQIIDETFAMIRWTYDLTSREDALLAVCLYFRTGKSEREHYQDKSNQEAWDSK